MINIPKDELKMLYENKKLSAQEIAKIYKCCKRTVLVKLHKFGIKVRKPGPPPVKFSRKDLIKWYIKEKLSTHQIEKKYGIPRSTVYRKLKE
jgi:transcriptional antiterminator